MIISEALSKINLNSARIAKLLKSINDEIAELSSVVGQLSREKSVDRVSLLKTENAELEKEVEKYKQELIQLRIANDVPQVKIPIDSTPGIQEISKKTPEAQENVDKSTPDNNVALKKEKSVKSQSNQTVEPKEASFGQLDIRVGKIVEVEKHPNADSLYVEKVDFGEAPSKTIISGLVNHVPLDEMKNRLALFLINLKPVKMRNITSEGMIMCANDGEKVEILKPPEGSVPGDIVRVEGHEYKPEPVLNPKKKIFETLAPFLRVNENKIATFKNISWDVGGKGPATTQTVVNAQIK